MPRKLKVPIVDDSAVIRALLSEILGGDPDIEVVGTACDPFAARTKLLEHRPDVMTLDVEMPKMDGITFLRRVMAHVPTPTVVISSLSQKSSETSMRALEAGAVAVVAKPIVSQASDLARAASLIIAEVKTAARSNVAALRAERRGVPAAARPQATAMAKTTHQVLAIASSTGGTEALKVFLAGFPADIPGTVIVQHMPPGFTRAFAARLNELLPFDVREAEDGDRVIPGRVLLAPGNYHMEMTRNGAFYQVRLNQAPPENSVRPAADVLMRTVARAAGKNAFGAVLTGMGRDAASGLKAMRDAGAYVVAQDEASCVVFGMPKAAIEAGAVDKVLPLEAMAEHLVRKIEAAASIAPVRGEAANG
jgi:two-component system chemotaxis response regulator CheB